jgi:hypothetical protein
VRSKAIRTSGVGCCREVRRNGDSAPTVIRGPGVNNFDVALTKNLPVTCKLPISVLNAARADVEVFVSGGAIQPSGDFTHVDCFRFGDDSLGTFDHGYSFAKRQTDG